MAYEPKTWSCGDVITANDLNHIEQGIAESGGCDCGYECTETKATAFDGSITTNDTGGGLSVGAFTPSQTIDGDSIIVTMDGTEYELPKIDIGGAVGYGEMSGDAPSFTTYPCFVISSGMFATVNPGTYTVKIENIAMNVTTEPCFDKAVRSVAKVLKNLLDGEANGSLRNIASMPEGDGYSLGQYAVALGYETQASGNNSFAEGNGSIASGGASHAEGVNTTASGAASHAEGASAKASGEASHAETQSTASGDRSHAEGSGSTASGDTSHAEGDNTTASGYRSHAEGYNATASGEASHAQNESTIARGRAQTAIGKFNTAQGNPDTTSATDYAFIIGNGQNTANRSNAFAIKWDGTFVFANGTEITPAQFASLLALLNA